MLAAGKDNRATTAIDKKIGQRLRERRSGAGLSQQALAEKLGITFQQVQKYEKGANRISATRLLDIVRVLNIPIEDMLDFKVRPASSSRDRDVAKMLEAFTLIGNRALRQKAIAMVKEISRPALSRANKPKGRR